MKYRFEAGRYTSTDKGQSIDVNHTVPDISVFPTHQVWRSHRYYDVGLTHRSSLSHPHILEHLQASLNNEWPTCFIKPQAKKFQFINRGLCTVQNRDVTGKIQKCSYLVAIPKNDSNWRDYQTVVIFLTPLAHLGTITLWRPCRRCYLVIACYLCNPPMDSDCNSCHVQHHRLQTAS